MEFTFEFENSDFVVEFESSFFNENFSDREDLRWNLHHGNYTPIVGDVFSRTYGSESICQCVPQELRLCSGYNAEKLR